MYDYSFQDELKKRERLKKKAFSILGLRKSVSKKDIRKQFLSIAKKHHPDKGGDEKSFKEIILAYKILTDENMNIDGIEFNIDRKEKEEDEQKDEKYKTENEWGYAAWWMEKFYSDK